MIFSVCRFVPPGETPCRPVVSLAVPLPMHQILNLPLMPALCNDVLDIVHVFATSRICLVLECPKVAIFFVMKG